MSPRSSPLIVEGTFEARKDKKRPRASPADPGGTVKKRLFSEALSDPPSQVEVGAQDGVDPAVDRGTLGGAPGPNQERGGGVAAGA